MLAASPTSDEDGDRLNDIVAPAAVPWWPPAPGFWLLLALALVDTGEEYHRALRDATGKLMLSEGDDGEAQPGASVTLTIDRSIQFIAERALGLPREPRPPETGAGR